MRNVQGRTKRIRMLRIRHILPLLLLASCQFQPSRELPPEARVVVLATGYSQHEKHLQEAVKNALGERGEMLRIQSAGDSMREITLRLSSNKYSAVVVLDNGAMQLSRKLENRHIYFGQIFDYRLAEQMGERFRGVSIVPDAKPVFQILRSLDNRPKTIGIIAGPNLQPMSNKPGNLTIELCFARSPMIVSSCTRRSGSQKTLISTGSCRIAGC